ncbi:hypothetical protein JTB14_010083 [Gonioctena quinquepunctata]|nr:hypothetical protein JTB14_010083 [Gonioctena quinquepunctata]
MFSLPILLFGDTYAEGSWLVQANIHDINDVAFLKLYGEALLLVFSFFFGITHDKFTIRLINEQITLTVITLIGRLYSLFMIADLLKIFGLVGVSEMKYEEYLDELEEYMNSKNLPESLRLALLKYFEYRMKKRYFKEKQILDLLSDRLKIEMNLYSVKKTFENNPILNVLESDLGVLFTFMKIDTFLPGDVITRANTKNKHVFFILSGAVAVTNSDDREIVHLEGGDQFGLWVSADGNIMYSHVAIEISELLYLPKKVFLQFLEEHPVIYQHYDGVVKRNIERYSAIESSSVKGGDDVISELRARTLLESQHRKTLLDLGSEY